MSPCVLLKLFCRWILTQGVPGTHFGSALDDLDQKGNRAGYNTLVKVSVEVMYMGHPG
jgi:hypothetical protein